MIWRFSRENLVILMPILIVLLENKLSVIGYEEGIEIIEKLYPKLQQIKLREAAYAKLLKEAVALAITHHLNLSHLCKVWEQGDILYFVLPNIQAEFKKVLQITKFANKELFSAFDGNIYLNASAVEKISKSSMKYCGLFTRFD